MDRNKYKLLTPGPLTTTETVKEEMLVDLCTWDDDYKRMTQEIRAELLRLAHAEAGYTTVLMQGSGTFGVEAVLSSVIKDTDKLLIAVNGAYSKRMAEICRYHRLPYAVVETAYDAIPQADAIEEALKLHTELNVSARAARIGELLTLVGLKPEYARRYPHQFSGGQRQRIGIARALAVNPRFIVADEPVSALDVSVQSQIVNLLQDIQKQTRVAFLFIAHDLAVVEHISHRIMVMYLGKLAETGPARELCSRPAHPYTKALLSSVPSLDPKHKIGRIILKGDVPSPLDPPKGCRFHPRCPIRSARCETEEPVLRQVPGASPGHCSACHFAGQVSEFRG